MINIIQPNWPAPNNVHAFTTTRKGGVSQPPFDEANFALHVNDNKLSVLKNREQLKLQFNLPNDIFWLNQIHSTKVITLPQISSTVLCDADASYSNQKNQVSVVMTADCLPILLCNENGTEIASVHAGWRGLCNGIIQNTLSLFNSPPANIMAWLGPAIGPTAFEVGEEVKIQFLNKNPDNSAAFVDFSKGKYLANLYLLASIELNRLGVDLIFGGDYCTYNQEALFYSYRKNNVTGRMASLIWFD